MDDDSAGRLEAALAATEADAKKAVGTAARLQRALRTAERAAALGDMRALHRAVADAEDAVGDAAEAVAALADGWQFTEGRTVDYLSTGHFANELLAQSRQTGLGLFDLDGVLACYPSLVRVVARQQQVTIDRKPYRNIRPSHLVAHLQGLQRREPRLKADQFLEMLLSAYRLLSRDGGGVEKLVDIHRALTILPSARADYSLQEFARDVYLLDGSGLRTAKDGSEIRLHAGATAAKTRVNLLVVVTRDGVERTYYGIEFLRGAPR